VRRDISCVSILQLVIGLGTASLIAAPHAVASPVVGVVAPSDRIADAHFLAVLHGQRATVDLSLRNNSHQAGAFHIRFLPDVRRMATVVTSRSVAVRVVSHAGLVPAGGTRTLRVALRLPPAVSPQVADGLLLVGMGTKHGAPALVRVRGLPPDVAFEPSQVTLDVSQGCFVVGGRCGAAGEVIVRGRQARALLRTGGPLAVAVLRNTSGGSVAVRLGEAHERDGAVVVRVVTNGLAEAGEYRGSLPLDPAGGRGPALVVDVRARWALSIAILTVFFGAFVGGFLRRRYDVVRRRTLLEVELRGLDDRYRRLRRGFPGPIHSFDIDRLFQKPVGPVDPFPQGDDASVALWAITHARDDDDFSEAAKRVGRLGLAIRAWELIEPAARAGATAAREVDECEPIDEMELSRMGTVADLNDLLQRVSQSPKNEEECIELSARLAAQVEVVTALTALWRLWTLVEAGGGYTPIENDRFADLEVIKLEKMAPREADRLPEASRAFARDLAKATARLSAILGELRPALDTRSATIRPGTDESGTIGAAIGASEFGSRLRRVLRSLRQRMRRLRISTMERLLVTDIVWSLARGLVAVMAYTLTVYHGTWGTTKDFLTAFTVGFVSETVVDWARMPAFQTLNRRSVRRKQGEKAGHRESEGPTHETPAPPNRQM
jgi:hypothetical protein